MTALPHISGYDGEAVAFVLKHLAPLDRIEAFDLAPVDDALTLFAMYQLQAGAFPVFHVIRETPLGAPVGFCGLTVTSPGMGKAHLLCTPMMHAGIAVHLARRIRAELPGTMAELGLHRVDCACLAQHRGAATFLRHAGARFETTLHRYGKSDSTYFQFAWIKGEDPCAEDYSAVEHQKSLPLPGLPPPPIPAASSAPDSSNAPAARGHRDRQPTS